MGERAELGDLGVAHLGHEPGDEAPVEPADEVGVGAGEVGERAVGERHDGGDRRRRRRRPSPSVGAVGHDRVEAEAVEVGDERLERRRGLGVARRPVPRPRSRRRPMASAGLAPRRWAMASTIRASIGIIGGSRPSDGASGASE